MPSSSVAVTMTALAAFFAMLPMALALGRGGEANAPLGRAILGGLLAGEPATLFVLPALDSLLSRIGECRRRPTPTQWTDADVSRRDRDVASSRRSFSRGRELGH